MPVAATGYAGKVLEAVRDVLSDCADFRSLMGAADATAARARCTLQTSRTTLAVPSCAIVVEDIAANTEANRAELHPVTVLAIMTWTPETSGGDTEADIVMRAINRFDGLLAALRNLIGTASYLARADMVPELPRWCDDNNQERAGKMQAGILFTWEN